MESGNADSVCLPFVSVYSERKEKKYQRKDEK